MALVEQWLEVVNNNPIIAFIIFVVLCINGLGTLAGKIMNVKALWKQHHPPSPNTPYSCKWEDQDIVFNGGNGTSIEQAVIIEGAVTSDAGIAAQYYWLKLFYPDYDVVQRGQPIESNEKRRYYYFDMVSSTGFRQTIYFDTTSFFGSPCANQELQKMWEKSMIQIEGKIRNIDPELLKKNGKVTIEIKVEG